MTFYPLWPIFAIIALAIACTFVWPLSSLLDEPQTPTNRAVSLDGLRGFLAIGVFVHHYSMMHVYLRTGTWTPPESQIYALLGEASVALFFMITGFLFWGKLVDSGGSPGWGRLYIGRLFRIGPLYLAVVAAMILIVLQKTGWVLTVPAGEAARSIATWLGLGLFSDHPDINGLANTRLILVGVTWTLHFEWFFYLSLLPLSLFARRRFHFFFSAFCFFVLLIASTLVPRALSIYGTLFFAGMLSASLLRVKDLRFLQKSRYAALAVSCLFFLFTIPVAAHTVPRSILLSVFFLVAASGNTFWGSLSSRTAHRLGNMSYGIYLIQGIAITMVMWNRDVIKYALSSPVAYWLLALPTLVLLLSMSSYAYFLIEKPGIAFGKRLCSTIFSKNKTPLPNDERVPT